jgi:catalase
MTAWTSRSGAPAGRVVSGRTRSFFDREVIPERRMHAKGSRAHGTFAVSHDVTRYTKAKIFSAIGKKTELFT